MSFTRKFKEMQSVEREMEMRVNTGEEECVIARNILAQKRSKRLKRDVRKELPALHRLSGAIKGAVTRKNWPIWKMILEQVKVDMDE